MEYCLANISMKASLYSVLASFPVSVYVRQSWPLFVGFLGGTAVDLYSWTDCMNMPLNHPLLQPVRLVLLK